jgi:hypothetical protein
MIVDLGEPEESIRRVIYGISFDTRYDDRSVWVQWDENYKDTDVDETLVRCYLDDMKIVDPRIPPNWVLERSELGYEIHPANLTFDMLSKAQDNMTYEYALAMNEVRAFHNFPLMKIPQELLPPEEIEKEKLNAEREKLNAQLDEYQRIGEEIEKESSR